jgi:isoamylase
LFSQGTPMMLGGDEFGRTQQGNNNAYCQDSDISWFDWNFGDDANKLLAFTKRLIKLRQAYPTLRRTRFLTGQFDEGLGIRDVTWINANGQEMQQVNWKDPGMKCFGMMLDGRAQKTGIKRRGEDKTVLMVMNSWEGPVGFTLPASDASETWSLLIDTNLPEAAEEIFKAGDVYEVTGRSLLLFAVNPAAA